MQQLDMALEFAEGGGSGADEPPVTKDGWAEEHAAKQGCVVVYPQPNQLQIDIDTEAAYAEFNRRLGDLLAWDSSIFGDCSNAPQVVIQPSKSGLPHRHITLTFPDRTFDRYERIALQMLLGSDPVREKMNTLRTLRGNPAPVRLFERPA